MLMPFAVLKLDRNITEQLRILRAVQASLHAQVPCTNARDRLKGHLNV